MNTGFVGRAGLVAVMASWLPMAAWGLGWDEHGAIPDDYGVLFRVWAGDATNVAVIGEFNDWDPGEHTMELVSNGVWEVHVPGAFVGQTYRYLIHGEHERRDPRNLRTAGGGDTASVVHDRTTSYELDLERLFPFHERPLNDMILYQLHVGTFNDVDAAQDGGASLDDAREKLDHLVHLGVNTILLMPVTELSGGDGTGYEPTDPFAVDNLTYGGPDALKRFVKAANRRGLAVMLDVVHSHYGSMTLPGDLHHSLWEIDGDPGAVGGGAYFDQDPDEAFTPEGRRPDYARPQVRDYIKHNLQMWMEEYGVNGFRWHGVESIRATTNGVPIAEGISLLQEMNAMLHSLTNLEPRISIAGGHNELFSTTEPAPGGLGFDSDWHPGVHHALTEELAKLSGFDTNRVLNAINSPLHTRRVVYTEAHDEVGNPADDKVRVPVTMDPGDPDSWLARKKTLLAAGLMFASPGIPMLFQGQEFLTPTSFSPESPLDWSLTNTHARIVAAHRDLIALRRNRLGVTGGFTGSYVEALSQPLVFTNLSVLTLHRQNSGGVGDDVFVVANPSGHEIHGDWIDWPATGTWYAVFNSDDPEYGADFGGKGYNETLVYSDLRGAIDLAPWSFIVYARAPVPSEPDEVILELYDTSSGFYGPDPYPMSQVGPHVWSAEYEYTWSPNWTHEWISVATVDGVVTQRHRCASRESYSWDTHGVLSTSGVGFCSVYFPGPATYRFLFHGVTGEYAVHNLVDLPLGFRHASMAFAANVNGFDLTPNMHATTNGEWEVTLPINQTHDLAFRFAAYEAWDVSWGGDGTIVPSIPADEVAISGSTNNLVVAGPFSGIYRIRFNDRTAAYQIDQVSPSLVYTSMAVAGTFNGWDTTPNMTSNGLHEWSATIEGGGRVPFQFKFVANGSFFDPMWSFPMSHDPEDFPIQGTLVQNEPRALHISGNSYGTYSFTFNSETLAYTVDYTAPTQTIFAIPGSYNGWSTTPTMTNHGLYQWSLSTNLVTTNDVAFKFSANDGWSDNWGIDNPADHRLDGDFPTGDGLAYNGDDILIPGPVDGAYTFLLDLARETFRVDRQPLPAHRGAMAVAGTHNGWDPVPGMSLNDDNEWVSDLVLDQPEALELRFAADGSLTHAWGSDGVHPTNHPAAGFGDVAAGSLMLPGPFRGTYRFVFNDRTLQYRVSQLAPAWGVRGLSAPAATEGMVIRWMSETGAVYEVRRGSVLDAGFDLVATNLPATPPLNTYTDSAPPDSAGFYLIQEQP